MKLSPPASSSDLEAAREVARRLHEQRRQAERPATAAAPMVVRRPAPRGPRLDAARGADADRPRARPAPPRAERPQRPTPVAPPVPEPPPLPPTPPPVVAPPRPDRRRRRLQVPPAIEPPPRPAHERPAAPPRAPEPRPCRRSPPLRPGTSEQDETPEAEAADALSALGDAAGLPEADDEAPASDDDAIEIEETNTTLEEMVGAAELPSVEEIVGPSDLDVGDDALVDEGDAYEPPRRRRLRTRAPRRPSTRAPRSKPCRRSCSTCRPRRPGARSSRTA